MPTKANYRILMFTFIINLFMALSLNSFSSSALYLPMMFLYFLSGLAAFVDKISFYNTENLYLELQISWVGFLICLIHVCIYLAYSLGFIEINFQYNGKTYCVLMQGMQNAFFTFNSINITHFIFVSAYIIPFAYPAFCIIPYLRKQGFTTKKVVDLFLSHKIALFALIIISTATGFIGIAICRYKAYKTQAKYGEPQYGKYFIVFLLIGLFGSGLFLLHHYKDKKN